MRIWWVFGVTVSIAVADTQSAVALTSRCGGEFAIVASAAASAGEQDESVQDVLPPHDRNPSRRPGHQGAPPMIHPPAFPTDGPWNRDVLVYKVKADGKVEQVATFERAGVPTIARLSDGRLIVAHQHFPANDPENFDKVAVRFSEDDGRTWSGPQVIQMVGLPAGMRFPFDPTLVPLPDGRVRLYFTGNFFRNAQPGMPAIYSAISDDGVNYNYEPGTRFAIEGRAVIDCAVVIHKDVFHLYAPDNGAGNNPGDMRGRAPADLPREGVGYHAISNDGLNFKRVADVRIDGRRRWLGNAQSDGKVITFYGTGEGMNSGRADGRPVGGHWIATSTDGHHWTLAPNPPISGGDPGAVATRDGGLVVVITSEPVRNVQPHRVAPGGQPFPSRPPHVPPPPHDRLPEQNLHQRGAAGDVWRNLRVEKIASDYKIAQPAQTGSFLTGQDADIVLGAKGFNTSGGPLLFNHPTGLATDGKALLMTDRWNNRVLIWKSAPTGNAPPDLVLGQPDFEQNEAGRARHQMNWPGNVTISPDGQRLAVADTNNDRILIWTTFPTRNGQPADLVLDLKKLSQERTIPGAARERNADGGRSPNPSDRFRPGSDRESPNLGDRGGPIGPPLGRGSQPWGWPWGVWTDGTKLAVVATQGSAVLIWTSFPTRDNQPPDFVLHPDGTGTPRNVTSDGKTFFAVSDHNYGNHSRPATMVWNSFPNPSAQQPDWIWGEWVKGSLTPKGGLVVAGLQSIYVFNTLPRTAEAGADVILRPATYSNGDGPDAVVAQNRLYVCTYNGNHILGWHDIPTRDNQPADFSLGSDRTDQDTWAENFFIQNPVVATDGKSLFVTSDFDRKMFIWHHLPDESGAKPDLVMHLPEAPWDNELHGSTLALAGRSTVCIWNNLPLNGEPPDRVLHRRIGSVELGELTGVAFDDQYFYLSDRRAERIYVWRGIPDQDSEPHSILPMRSPGRLTSDGHYLCAAPFEGNSIQLWRVSELSSRAQPIVLGGPGKFNLPSECLIADGRLFICNRGFHRVDVWNRVDDALAGRPASASLGAIEAQDQSPAVARNKMFMPGSLAWGSGYLWVGEFKFSTRILRFSPAEKSVNSTR